MQSIDTHSHPSPNKTVGRDAVQERFLKPENRAVVLARDSVVELLRALEDWRPSPLEKWLDRETR